MPSPSGQSRWTVTVVGRILHNPVHAGLVPLGRGGREWLQGEHFEHRIYEAEVLEQLKEARDGRRRWKTNTLKRFPDEVIAASTSTRSVNEVRGCKYLWPSLMLWFYRPYQFIWKGL